jgi:hypothetical protein
VSCTRPVRGRGDREAGQATTETLLLTGILLIFVAALYQLFVVNETIFRSLAAVHQNLFAGAFEANCADAREECTYDGGDLRSKVIWKPPDIPEVEIPVVSTFAQVGLGPLRLTSNSPLHQDDFKRTKLGAGTYQKPFVTLLWAFQYAPCGCTPDPGLFETELDELLGTLLDRP